MNRLQPAHAPRPVGRGGEHRAAAAATTATATARADETHRLAEYAPVPFWAAMRHNRLGRSDLTVSVLGLGCNNFGRRLDRTGTRAVIDAALDAGMTLLDTADIYGGDGASERLIGEL